MANHGESQLSADGLVPESEPLWLIDAAAAKPDLPGLGRQMRTVSGEDTVLLSELLRRAIHRSSRHLAEIASAVCISLLELNEFLSGERTLPSDVLDRLASAVEFTRALSQSPAAGDK